VNGQPTALNEAYWSFLFVKVFQRRGAGGYQTVYDGSGDKIRPSKSGGFFDWVAATPNNSLGAFGNHDDLCSFDGKYTKIRAGAAGSEGGLRGIKFASRPTFDHGLFVFAANHAPAGYGVWPAFWLTAKETGGAAWACNGEIDFFEYANDAGQSGKGVSATTLHTNTKPTGALCSQRGVPGISNNGDCTAGDQGATCGCDAKQKCPNLGCGAPMPGGAGSAGAAFNAGGGGTFACELTPGGQITVWFWSAATGIPADILANRPDPSTWVAAKKVVFNPCPGQFANMQLVVDTKLCGDWAGNAFPH
jgi:hypothetical protein